MLNLAYRVLTATLAAVVAYSGYCVYLQSKKQELAKRCSYEQFESRLIEISNREASKSDNYLHVCELNTPFARRDYCIQKIKAANASLESGNVDEGIGHLIEAMAASSKPSSFLQCMSNTLPTKVFKRLIEKLSSFDH